MVGGILVIVLFAYQLILLLRIGLDWVILLTRDRGLPAMAVPYGIAYDLTEPVLRPIRRILPPLRIGNGALDLSPIVVFVALILLQAVARQL